MSSLVLGSPSSQTVETTPSGKDQPGPDRRLYNYGGFAIAIVVLAGLIWSHRWVTEDAFIDFRVIRNIVEGHGPLFNIGERVEANTSTLWVAFLSILDALHTPISLEWWSVITGLFFSLGGVALAIRGAIIVNHIDIRKQWVAPLGVLALIGMVPVWDFATSGLEFGMGFGWLGLCYFLLARLSAKQTTQLRPFVITGTVISLATMIRPDFGLFQVCFAVPLLLLAWKQGRRFTVTTIASLLLLPLLMEVFRMGYYAELGPNTALAKEASQLRIHLGLSYLKDFVMPYWLIVPVAAIAALAIVEYRFSKNSDKVMFPIMLAPLVGAALHGSYVVAIGGDFMHGRMLVPALFAAAMPCMAVPITRKTAALAAIVVCWGFASAAWLRPPYVQAVSKGGIIANERSYWQLHAGLQGSKHPANMITLADHNALGLGVVGKNLSTSASANPDHFYRLNPDGTVPIDGTLLPQYNKDNGVSVAEHIGLYGYGASSHTWIVDRLGLSDPLASRMLLTQRGRPGHEKEFPQYWFVARFTQPGSETPGLDSTNDIATARQVLQCPKVNNLLQSVTGKMTLGRFISNIVHTPQYWTLRIPADPSVAKQKLCH